MMRGFTLLLSAIHIAFVAVKADVANVTSHAASSGDASAQEFLQGHTFSENLGDLLFGDWHELPLSERFIRESVIKNWIFLPSYIFEHPDIPHVVKTWLRTYIAGNLVYFLAGGIWCIVIYGFFGGHFFPKGTIPARSDILKQIGVSMRAMPLYTALPAFSEYLVESGVTKCFSKISDVGYATYIVNLLVFLSIVEFSIYWFHRALHHRSLYFLHSTHHKYNKQNTLSPFAGLAFNPIDGIIQASPYVYSLFLVPMHFLTSEFMLFATGIWTTNIHDTIIANTEPVMGAGYHTIHHTTYKHNYGQYFIFMDKMFGTLVKPGDEKLSTKKKR